MICYPGSPEEPNFADKVESIHDLIKEYYRAIIPQFFSAVTLKALLPLIESIYHACFAGMYDTAFDLYEKSFDIFYLDSNIEAV